jgi:hypothetical protein
MPDWKERRAIAQDTLARVESIVASTPGASLDSTFVDSQLPALDLDACPGYEGTDIHVVNLDSFSAARNIARSVDEDCNGKIAVLNLASDQVPGGGWEVSLSTTQVYFITKVVPDRLMTLVGGGTLLLVHPLPYAQEVILPMAKHRTRLRRRDLFSQHRHF